MDKTAAFKRTLEKIAALTTNLHARTVAPREARAIFADLTNAAAGLVNYVSGGDAQLAAAYKSFAQANAYALEALDRS